MNSWHRGNQLEISLHVEVPQSSNSVEICKTGYNDNKIVPVAGLKSCITLNIKVHGNMTCKNK